MSNAYQQLEVDDETGEKLAWLTHKGIFKAKRLMYGAALASAIFQRELEKILGKIENVANYQDHILTGDKDISHYKEKLRIVLKKLQNTGSVLIQ